MHVMWRSCACHVHVMCSHVHVMCMSCAYHVHVMCMSYHVDIRYMVLDDHGDWHGGITHFLKATLEVSEMLLALINVKAKDKRLVKLDE